VLGSVIALGGNAINIGTAGVKVTLRNLNILPFPGSGSVNGIDVSSGATLAVQNCNISDFTLGKGLNVAAATQVTLIDSVFRSNHFGAAFDAGATARISGSQFFGGYVAVWSAANTTGLTTSVTVSRSLASNNSYGFIAETYVADAKSRLYVADSVMESNTSFASEAYVGPGLTGGVSETTMSGSLIIGNGTGLLSFGTGAKVTASGNTVTNNTTGFSASSGIFESAGNNAVRNNGNNTVGTILGVGTI
jgi:hypothetical protein